MKSLKAKLNNQKGITILFALLGFMVAAVISAVIITAALSAARRVENDRQITQNQLTLESAAQLIRDQMTGNGTESKKTTVSKTGSGGSTVYASSGVFASEMQTAVEYVDASGRNYESGESALTVSCNALDTVEVSYVMQSAEASYSIGDYYLIFTFTLEDSSDELYLTMIGSEKVDSSNPDRTIISWETVSINGLGGSNED